MRVNNNNSGENFIALLSSAKYRFIINKCWRAGAGGGPFQRESESEPVKTSLETWAVKPIQREPEPKPVKTKKTGARSLSFAFFTGCRSRELVKKDRISNTIIKILLRLSLMEHFITHCKNSSSINSNYLSLERWSPIRPEQS